MLEAAGSSEISVPFSQTLWCHILKDICIILYNIGYNWPIIDNEWNISVLLEFFLIICLILADIFKFCRSHMICVLHMVCQN